MTDWFDQLHATVGEDTHVLHAGDGRLLISDVGARVLACEMPGHPGNLFWTPSPLPDGEIVGGDRLWIAPEVAYHWPSLEKAREDPVKWASTPPQVDPGSYQRIDADRASIDLANRVELTDARSDRTIRLFVDREIHICDPPRSLPDELRSCSFTITNTLSLGDGDEGALAGAWDILQVPLTGTLICPTTHHAEPTSYFDPFGPHHVQCDDRAVRFLIDGRRRIKMGIPPEATTGRMGYYRPTGPGEASLIVRVFAPLPGDSYVDLPRHATSETRLGGDALQAYNDDGTFGDYGELEYHDPALIVEPGRPATRSGTCVTHVLTGPDSTLRQFAHHLLGVPIEPLSA